VRVRHLMTRPVRMTSAEPIDPEVEAIRPGRDVLVVVAVTLGGIVGAVGRYAATLWWPTGPTGFPWTTFGINLIGSFLLAIVVVLSTERWPDSVVFRPLLGTGVIGGFTTFSTFAVDQQRLITHGHALTAIAYLVGTLAVCLAATWAGQRATLAVVGRGRR